MERIELEEIARRLAAVGVALAIAAFAGLMMGAIDVPDLVQARRLEIVGADGKSRIRIFVDDQGEAAFVMTDPKGAARLVTSAEPDGRPLTTFRDGKGEVRMIQILTADNTAELAMIDVNGKARVAMGLEPDGTSKLIFQDGSDQAKLRGGLLADRHGTTALVLLDEEGTERLQAKMTPEGEPAFVQRQRGGTPSMVILTDKDGNPLLEMLDTDGKKLLSVPK